MVNMQTIINQSVLEHGKSVTQYICIYIYRSKLTIKTTPNGVKSLQDPFRIMLFINPMQEAVQCAKGETKQQAPGANARVEINVQGAKQTLWSKIVAS